jgi:hypothetical protein
LILAKLEERLSERNNSWIQKWVKGETSILEDIVMPYQSMTTILIKNETIKNDILKSLDDISVQELQSCGIRAKPECHDVWCCEDAADRMNIELLAMKNFISKLEKDNDQSD